MVNKEAILGFLKKNEQAALIVGGGLLGIVLLFGFVTFKNASNYINADLTPTPTPTVEASPTPSPTDLPDESPTPTKKKAKPTNTPSPGPSHTPTPGPTNTPAPDATNTPAPTVTPSITPTPTPNSISSISITEPAVDPGSYTGPCPKQFNFSAKITVNAPGIVSYRWERSDGASAASQNINFAAAGNQIVTTNWTLGTSGNTYNNFWEKLVITSPSSVTGSQMTFSATCT